MIVFFFFLETDNQKKTIFKTIKLFLNTYTFTICLSLIVIFITVSTNLYDRPYYDLILPRIRSHAKYICVHLCVCVFING